MALLPQRTRRGDAWWSGASRRGRNSYQEHQCRFHGTVSSASYGAGHTVHKEEDMSDYNEQTLMEAVIKRVAATPDPRLRQIMTSGLYSLK
jgi:hypothetical protein